MIPVMLAEFAVSFQKLINKQFSMVGGGVGASLNQDFRKETELLLATG